MARELIDKREGLESFLPNSILLVTVADSMMTADQGKSYTFSNAMIVSLARKKLGEY